MSSRSSKTEALPERVEVARIRRPHGLRGEVIVEVSTDVPGRLAPGVALLVALGDGGPASPVRVATTRPHAEGALLRLDGCDERGQAERLRGAALLIERRRVPQAPPGRWYHYELIGCRCRDRAAGDLGLLAALIEDGGGLLLEVRGEGRVLLIPFVEAFLRRVDVEGRQIELELPPGLVETCASAW